MFFSDYSLGKEQGQDLSFIDPIQDLQKRYLAVKHYFNRLGHFQQQSFEGGGEAESADAVSGSKTEVQLQSWNMGGARLRAIGKAVKSSLSKKKLHKLPSEMESHERRNVVASLAIPRAAAQSAQIFGGGRFYLSRPLCLTTKKSRYPKTA